MNNISFKQYRNIDLSIFTVLLVISEALATLATKTVFSGQPIAISTTLIFVCICLMRWSGYAVIHMIVGGLVFCLSSGASTQQYIVYLFGNAFCLFALFWFRIFKKEDVRVGPWKLVFFTASVYLLMQVGRWLLSLCFGGGVGVLIRFLTTDIISLLFAVVVMLILRNTDGMIEDQKHYLLRLEREREAERNEKNAGYFGYGSEE